jgi:protein TonB
MRSPLSTAMDNRHRIPSRHFARGAVNPVTLTVIAIVLALAVAAWFLIIKPYRDANTVATPATAAAAKPGATRDTPANVDALSTDQLLAEARTAMNEQRLVAPAGNNAFEFYMKVLQKQPGNPVAADALRETFSYGAAATEQTINQRDFNEAQREIDLLAKADPENYTLTILRSKLDAQRKTLDREQQQAVDAQKAQQLAQQNAANAAKLQAEQQASAAAEAQRQQAAREQAARVATQQPAAAAPVAAAPRPVARAATDESISEAVLIRQVNPRYPTAAMRANQEGWVDVEMTVGADGAVGNVSVVDAQPKHVFDRSAIDAVSKWEFKPATRNGEAISVTLRRRLQFNLGR